MITGLRLNGARLQKETPVGLFDSNRRFGHAVLSLGRRLLPGVSIHTDGIGMDELRILAFQLARRRGPTNVMVDVGAHHGYALEPFLNLGWTVFAFEPDSLNRESLEARVGGHPNLTVDPRALSDQDRRDASFFRNPISSGISSLSAFHDGHEHAEDVDVSTLAIAGADWETVTVLKVDTEGHDLLVLRGNDWERISPEIVVCEFEDRKTRLLGYEFDDLCHYLLARGYRLVVSEWYPVEEYGSTHRFRRATRYPNERRDPDSWGNLIAVPSRWIQWRLLWRLWISSAIGRVALRVVSPLLRHWS